jgi:hypothetical protein
MLTQPLQQKLNSSVALVCRDLGIEYDPRSGRAELDWRIQIIANALEWMAEYAYKEGSKHIGDAL